MGGGGQQISGAPGTNAGAMGLYDPNYNYGGGSSAMSMIGQGVGSELESFGKGIAGGAPRIPQFQAPDMPSTAIDSSQSSLGNLMIPESQGSGDLSEIMDLLRRLGVV